MAWIQWSDDDGVKMSVSGNWDDDVEWRRWSGEACIMTTLWPWMRDNDVLMTVWGRCNADNGVATSLWWRKGTNVSHKRYTVFVAGRRRHGESGMMNLESRQFNDKNHVMTNVLQQMQDDNVTTFAERQWYGEGRMTMKLPWQVQDYKICGPSY